jgi:hypothetical protein
LTARVADFLLRYRFESALQDALGADEASTPADRERSSVVADSD